MIRGVSLLNKKDEKTRENLLKIIQTEGKIPTFAIIKNRMRIFKFRIIEKVMNIVEVI